MSPAIRLALASLLAWATLALELAAVVTWSVPLAAAGAATATAAANLYRTAR